MTLAWLPLLLAFAALTTRAMAGDKPTSSETASSNAEAGTPSSAPLVGAENLPPNPDVTQDLVFAPDAEDRVPRLRTRDGLSLADVNGDVCYTMRTYKVKPTERIRDHDNLFQGYSQCEMASNYQIRSAEAHQKKPHWDESPASLK